jgi:DNA-binding transcriptional LysR family regulator
MNRLQCQNTFIRVVEKQSFSAAARTLFCSAPQVSKEISWLEDHLGVTLLSRTTRALQITEAGTLFYAFAKNQTYDFQNIKNTLHNKDTIPQGTLRMTMPTAFGENIMLPYIQSYLKNNAEVTLDLKLSNRFYDLHQDDIDLAIRTQHPGNKHYACIPFMTVQRRVFGSKAYFEKHGTPECPNDLLSHQILLHGELDNPYRWVFKDNEAVTLKPRLLCNSVVSLIHAAAKNLGVLYLSELQVIYHHIPAIKHLVSVLDDYALAPTQIYLCYKKQAVLPKKIEAFIDLILADQAG